MAKRFTLVTHPAPHIDDVAALWQLQRFDPKYTDANLMFVPAEAARDLLPNHVGVGVGRGAFDEHKGDKKECATTLVWKYLRRRKLLPGGLVGAALVQLVADVLHDDLGLNVGQPGNFRSNSHLLRTIAGLPDQDSILATRWGYTLMDALLELYVKREVALRAVRKGIRFQTRWGKAIAVRSDIPPFMASDISAELGYALVVVEHPKRLYLNVRSYPRSSTDLSKLASAVREIDGFDAWYLHHSKRMLIHGGLTSPADHRSKLRLENMVKLMKKVCA